MKKQIVVTLYRQNHVRPDWKVDLTSPSFRLFFLEIEEDLQRFGIGFSVAENPEYTIDINSYADVLNAIRLSSPADNFTNVCVGHIIGRSPNRDIAGDIRRAVNRIAFAPETVPPEDHNRKVCHNCGCGC